MSEIRRPDNQNEDQPVTMQTLAGFALDIANRASSFPTDPLKESCDIQEFSSDARAELELLLQKSLEEHLAQGRIVVINDDVSGVVTGLVREGEVLQVAVIQRYKFDKERELVGSIPHGEISSHFDQEGRCVIGVHDQSGEDPIIITSPSRKKRGQDRFSIVSGAVVETDVHGGGSTGTTTSSFIVHASKHGGLPKGSIGRHLNLGLPEVTWNQKQVGDYFTATQTLHPDHNPISFKQQFVSDIQLILCESLPNNREPWDPNNIYAQPGSWLINF